MYNMSHGLEIFLIFLVFLSCLSVFRDRNALNKNLYYIIVITI